MRISFVRYGVAVLCIGAVMSLGVAGAQDDDRASSQPPRPNYEDFQEDRREQDDYRSQRNQFDQGEQDRLESSQQREQRRNQDRARSQSSQQSGQQGGLGVNVDDGRLGARVTAVMQSTPAQEADLRQGDEIVEIDGNRVRSADDVVQRIRGRQSGEQVELTVVRQGRARTMDVELTSRQQALSRTQRDQQGIDQRRQNQSSDQYAQRDDDDRTSQQWRDDYSQDRNTPLRPGTADSGRSQQQMQQVMRQLENLQRQVAQLQRELQQMRSEQRYDAQRTGYQSEEGSYGRQGYGQQGYGNEAGRYQDRDQFDQPSSYDYYDE